MPPPIKPGHKDNPILPTSTSPKGNAAAYSNTTKDIAAPSEWVKGECTALCIINGVTYNKGDVYMVPAEFLLAHGKWFKVPA